MSLTAALGSSRAQTLAEIVVACAQEAYAENAARFSDELGDNNMTFATCVIHNLRHLLAEALTDEPGVRIERPHGSFQVVLGRAILHFYKGRLGPAESIEIRFDESRTKRLLVKHNAGQLQLFDDDDTASGASSVPMHLVFVHAGDHEDGLRGLWVGAPVVSGMSGFRWLWHDQIYGDPDTVISAAGATTKPEVPWIDEAELPDLIVDIRDQRREDEHVEAT